MFEYQIILGRIGDIDGCIGAVFHIIIHNKYNTIITYCSQIIYISHFAGTICTLPSALSFLSSALCRVCDLQKPALICWLS